MWFPWTNSQILTVVGLGFEFLSLVIALSVLFWSEEKRNNGVAGLFMIVLLGLGMFLQGLAVFS